jgi:eukaryotic-like serine/threonine-protein kinase
MIGKVIAQYKIVEALGQGGMGTVYKAHDTRLDRMVVLKLLSRDLIGSETARGRFMREARLASALDHPNICTTFEIQESEDTYYIAMQYIEGQSLKKAINNKPMATTALISITMQVADALATAHDRGIIHRDIKPQNIMITPRGQAKVLDFGLAKSLKEKEKDSKQPHQADLTEVGESPGTPAYMSPEQAKRDRVDRRSDIFSFGTVLYEMATGFKPFGGKNNVDILYAVCNEIPKPISNFNPEAMPGLQEILDKAMAKDPSKRYQTMQAMLADLKFISSGGIAGQYVPDGIHKAFVPIERARSRWLEKLLPKSMRRSSSTSTDSAIQNSAIANEISLSRTLTGAQIPDDFPIIPGQHKTLAILPFRSLGCPDNTWSLSFLDAIITEMARFKSLTIRPSSYVTKYLNQDVNPADVGHELGVDAVMIGSFVRTEIRLRLTAQLIDIGSGGILWGGKQDASETDPIRLLDIACQGLVSKLSGKQIGSTPFDLLKDESEEIRIDAVSMLKFSNDPQAVEALADAISDSSMKVKLGAVEALARFGRAATPAVLARLEESMRDKEFTTARFAARAAGLLGSAESVPLLLEALGSNDSLLASESAIALGKLKDRRAERDLIEALSRPDANVRFTSAQALGELGEIDALSALETRMREDDDEGVRIKALWAIKHISRKAAGN